VEEELAMNDSLARLMEIGFKIAGVWKLDGEGIACELNDLAVAHNRRLGSVRDF
jgi:hypothetical protein